MKFQSKPELKWVVQKNLLKPSILTQFREAFEDQNILFEEVVSIPFSNSLPLFNQAKMNIFYGSTTLMLNAHRSEHYKGVFYDPEQFNMKTYLDKWSDKMLNYDGKIDTFKQFVENELQKAEKWFLRPISDTKSFSGAAMNASDILDWYSKIQSFKEEEVNPQMMIFFASPKSISKEWRNFIVNGKVIDSSRYMLNGSLDVNSEDVPSSVIQFCEENSSLFSPHAIFVLDVAESNGAYKIIECNCFNATGFYNNDLKKIVSKVTEFCLGRRN
ncbi:MAG: ATP-grasp domain-containing protein [Flavobacteriales bacterium]|nr:ATP-grasp domain-containing protein [Flavobacteriales bacterium]